MKVNIAEKQDIINNRVKITVVMRSSHSTAGLWTQELGEGKEKEGKVKDVVQAKISRRG